MYGKVKCIRSVKFTKADVIFSPTPKGNAHADVVFFTKDFNVDGSIAFLDDVVSFFKVLLPENLSGLFQPSIDLCNQETP